MDRKSELMELRVSGLTYEKIGEKHDISKQRVHQLLTGYKPKYTPATPAKKRYHKLYMRTYSQTPEGKRILKATQRRINEKIKRLVFSHYIGNEKIVCVGCGFGDIRTLTLDHINSGGSLMRKTLKKTGISFYRWLIKNNYPAGYQVLCMNCQWIKRHQNHEWGT